MANPYYRPQLPPNTSPSGRGINPATGRIGDMPGGLDYLAGFGPAPAGVNLPEMAPIIHGASLPGLGQTHLQAFMNALQRFKPAANRTPTPWTPINPYATPQANMAASHAIQAAAPQTPWYQTPNLFNNVPAAPTTAPTIQWAGSGMPYAPMADAYKSVTAGLTPAQILKMFPG